MYKRNEQIRFKTNKDNKCKKWEQNVVGNPIKNI